MQEALDRCKSSFESRVQKYQPDWRLQLLLTVAFVMDATPYRIPDCRCLDIFLEMDDDHDLHLVDQNALDLRHHDKGSLMLLPSLSRW